MGRKAVLERGPRLVQQGGRREHVNDQPIVLLTEAEAAARVKVLDGAKNPARQFREWATRKGVPVKYVGRRRAYDERLLLAFIDGESWTRRHRPLGK
jgi:hypothetical protein